MTDLPQGWEWATLGDLGEYVNGRGFKKSEWAAAGRPIVRIQNLTGSGAAFNYFAGEADERHVARYGDLLVSWAATLGVFVWRGPEAVINQHIFKVVSQIDPAFHRYLLTHVLDDLRRQTHGSGMVHITKQRFDATSVPLPPPAEQERIVAALEEHLSRLDATAALVKSGEFRLGRFEQAVLSHLVEPTVRRCRLGDVLAEPLVNGRSVRTQAGGFPVLRLTCLRDRRILLGETKPGEWTADQAKPFLVQRGDFLVSRGNGSLGLVGRGGLVDTSPPPVAYPDTLIRVRVDPQHCDPRYLSLVWDSRTIRDQIERSARTTAGIYKINQRMLEQFELPLPPLDVQREIATRAEGQLQSLTRLHRAINDVARRSEGLRRSILAATFSGRLVPQDPAEEPASALLDRIRVEQSVSTPARRRRSKVAS